MPTFALGIFSGRREDKAKIHIVIFQKAQYTGGLRRHCVCQSDKGKQPLPLFKFINAPGDMKHTKKEVNRLIREKGEEKFCSHCLKSPYLEFAEHIKGEEDE